VLNTRTFFFGLDRHYRPGVTLWGWPWSNSGAVLDKLIVIQFGVKARPMQGRGPARTMISLEALVYIVPLFEDLIGT
jgi:hypothetical protein